MRRLRLFIIATVLLLSPFVWTRLISLPRTNVVEPLYAGVVYQRQIWTAPRDVVAHIVEIDLTTPGLAFLVTPGEGEGAYVGRTTADFLAEFDLQLAINGSFYRFARNNRERLQPLGQTISNGVAFTPSRRGWPVLCMAAGNQISMATEACPAGTEQGVAGNVMLVVDGQPTNLRSGYFPGRANSRRLEPRTAVALDQASQTMWLVVVDGRRAGYSEGLMLAEFAQLLADLGAYQALNLDGGGSSTLVRSGWLQPETLNAPAAYPILPQQRPVATHLGVYAPPLGR